MRQQGESVGSARFVAQLRQALLYADQRNPSRNSVFCKFSEITGNMLTKGGKLRKHRRIMCVRIPKLELRSFFRRSHYQCPTAITKLDSRTMG